jgi:hypothetical protein
MKHASQWALLSAAVVVGIAYSCATPQEVTGCPPGATSPDCDVTLVPPSDFDGPDASVIAQGGGAGAGVSPSGGGAGSGSSNPPPAGAAGTGPSTGGSAGSGAAGAAGAAGAGGAAGSGGAAGAAGTAGTAGAGGAAGSGAAGSGAAGTGGTTAQSNFDPGSCNFDNRAGCEAQACATACPANMGNYCTTNCPNIITCLAADPSCITEQDPMCAVRTNGQPNQCTSQVENSGGANTTNANDPAFVARALVQCLCDSARL